MDVEAGKFNSGSWFDHALSPGMLTPVLPCCRRSCVRLVSSRTRWASRWIRSSRYGDGSAFVLPVTMLFERVGTAQLAAEPGLDAALCLTGSLVCVQKSS